jgi:ADP-ribose pyrophosphatase YjhB (NUDIX family)
MPDDLYEIVYNNSIRLCADVLIRTEKGILLSRRNIEPFKGLWHLPGGRVLLYEDPKDAAKRIARKELGFDVEVTGLAGYGNMPSDGTGLLERVPRHSVSLIFLVDIVGGELKLDFQATEGRWHTLMPNDMHPYHGPWLYDNGFLI